MTYLQLQQMRSLGSLSLASLATIETVERLTSGSWSSLGNEKQCRLVCRHTDVLSCGGWLGTLSLACRRC